MDANNWRPTAPGGEPVIDTGDWRIQLQPDSRKRIVDKIIEILKRHLPFSGQEGLQELKKIAVRFEEKIYTAATNQFTVYAHRQCKYRKPSILERAYIPLPPSLVTWTAHRFQSDYLRKISLKMLAMETKSQNTIPTGNGNAAKH
uniref:Mediator complex subunit 15 KIX domain-containing protein n=1 Tax=Populus alba TaxID=43335 RepID=A0A4U5Q7G8_POPAL|nr:hypothetical protein D5086_0000140860 [Populus alba]